MKNLTSYLIESNET